MDDATASEAAGSQSSEPPHHDGNTGSSSSSNNSTQQDLPHVILIDPTGDLLLDVTFETSKSTLKAATAAARKANLTTTTTNARLTGQAPPLPPNAARVRLAFRVDRAQLRQHSRYFAKLLDVETSQFREARDVAAALERLAARGVEPGSAEPRDLPRVGIVDDDEATRYAGREGVFADLLRILHGREVSALGGDVNGNGKGEGEGVKDSDGKDAKKKSATTTVATPTTAVTTTPTKGAGGGKGAVNGSRQQHQQKQKQKQRLTPQKQQQKQVTSAAPVVGMPFVVTLAVLADRFDCTAAVSRWLTSAGPKVRWPVTSHSSIAAATGGKSMKGGPPLPSTTAATVARDGDAAAMAPSMSRGTEELLRQKILVAWLLDLPMRFQNATRELILNGSCRWSAFGADEEEGEGGEVGGDGGAMGASWWYLPDGLEQELQHRRHTILNTVASIPQHFLRLYSTPRATGRQCKLGYDSSAACDSYQLGEMVKFLLHKRLLHLTDFSPRSLDALATTTDDAALAPVDALLAALRQCPAYQIDKHHHNCGLRTRLLPVLDFVRGLLSAGSVPISRAAWRRDRANAAWMPGGADAGYGYGYGGGGGGGSSRWQDARADADDTGSKPFRFTRSLLGDQRLRFENAMGADKFARDVFTASSWDWTAED